MKKTITALSLCLISFGSFAASDCKSEVGCEAKTCEIKQKIKIAKNEGNTKALDGLENALEETEKYCTPEDIREELEEKIEDTKNDIKDYQSDILEAQASQKFKKAKDYEKKLNQEKRKLEKLEEELIKLK